MRSGRRRPNSVAIARRRRSRHWTTLQKRWPDFQSADGHLLYARALTEGGRIDEALEEYHALVAYAPSAEARVRYGMLLRMVGRTAEA